MQISLKKLLLLLLIIILLAKFKLIITMITAIFMGFYDAFEPLRERPAAERYIVALAFLALIYLTIYKLLLNRKK